MSDSFYRAFEDRHRGSREAIQARQRDYLPFLHALRELQASPRLIDLGCGRGEWLELARAEGWQVQGVDLDEAMLEAPRAAGLDVRQGDALRHLRDQADMSVDVVSGFHIAEHLPFDTLRELVSQAWRVLRPGGLLMLETPNPENLIVGASAFHMDPTHVKPLPPLLLAFVAESAGFDPVTTLRLHEGIQPASPVALIDVLAGVSPDYAIVARKSGGAASPALDALFAQHIGVTLNELAERYEKRSDERLRELQVTADLAREAAVQFASARRELLSRMDTVERALAVTPALEQRAIDRVFQLQEEVAGLHTHIREIHASTSWRVTSPLRWASEQRLAIAHASNGVLQRFPRVHALARSLARGLRLVPRRPLAPPAEAEAGPATPMTVAARRVHEQLDQAIDAASRRKDH